MPRKFLDKLTKLKAIIQDAGQQGAWTEIDDYHQFRSANEGIVNFWPKSQTINFQGKSPGKEELEAIVEAWENSKRNILDAFD